MDFRGDFEIFRTELGVHRFSVKIHPKCFRQLKACLWKKYWSYWRSPSSNLRRIMFVLMLALLFGCLFFDQAKKIHNQQSLFNMFGSMYCTVMFCGFNNTSSILSRAFHKDVFHLGLCTCSGTIIDSKICHPRNYEFHLCANAGMIGTTRPTHYHVLYDEVGLTPDDLQELVHSLSCVKWSIRRFWVDSNMNNGLQMSLMSRL